MNSLKTAIVGAGICGLYLARKLSQRGYNVTVFEKKEKIGKQACSGLFSERILEFIPESEKLIQNQIDSVLIHFPRRTIRIKFSKRFLVMSHFELDNLAADLAAASGAKIILNHPVNSLPEGFSRVIGCDGPNSVIRKSLGLGNPAFRLAIQGFIPKEDYSPFVETWPVKNGFIWKIPRGKEMEYGIIAKPKEAKKLFEDFLNPVVKFRQSFSEENLTSRSESKFYYGVKKNNPRTRTSSVRGMLQLERLTSALVPQGFIISKHPSITLCGDAAGLTKPWSGGGVIWGLMSSEILLKNFPDFLKYQKELKRFFLPKIILSGIATKMAYFLGFNSPWILPKNVRIEGDFLI